MLPSTINVIFQISYMSSKFGHPLLYTYKPVSLKRELEMPGQVGSFHISLFEGPSQSEMF